jgi:5-methylcytosine-specific restriction enzyme A
MKRYHRYSQSVIRSKRWVGLRLLAKRRDNFKCVQCGYPRRLQIDHILSVKTHPQLAFTLSNLQTLCHFCHARKTQAETFGERPDDITAVWRDSIRALEAQTICY